MKKTSSLLLLSLAILTPLVTFAQEPSLQNFLRYIPTFIGETLIPFLFAIAFLLFVYNTIRYFVIEAGNDSEREKAKGFALYSIFAFLFLVCLWGLVNLLTNTLFGTETQTPIQSDYVEEMKKKK